MPEALREFAPAKLNLYLHVTGRRADGYHLLDSLVVFADVGDVLEAMPADSLSLRIEGPFAAVLFPVSDDNLVLRAARELQKELGIIRGAALTLTKQLPVASGIGGGSADAAAALRLLLRLWDAMLEPEKLDALALRLGADVPVCLRSQAARMQGVGEKVAPLKHFPAQPALLVNPGIALATKEVFAARRGAFSSPYKNADYSPHTLREHTHNDLEAAAVALCPAIGEVLERLRSAEGCQLARMSGSGATCFAVFDTVDSAKTAAAMFRSQHEYWVSAVMLK